LIRKELGAAAQVFTVIFTVNLPGTKIGAGFRSIVKKGTFRDLSPSIGSRDDCRRDQGPSCGSEMPQKIRRHQTTQPIVYLNFSEPLSKQRAHG
jgi:hypothetical protein